MQGASTAFEDTFLELRAAEGGDDSCLFVADVVRMYERYARRCGDVFEVLECAPAKVGLKMAVIKVQGKVSFDRWKHEGGIHRIQRVPPTERNGRRHTSAVTVAVLRIGEDEDSFNVADVEFEVKRAGGPGGQHQNKTESAVKAIHTPTGLTAECRDERSQHQNKQNALQILRMRVASRERALRQNNQRADTRKQIANGYRAEHTRTYNFIDGFVADEHTGRKIYNLKAVLNGDLTLLHG